MNEQRAEEPTLFRCLGCGRRLAYIDSCGRFDWVYSSWDTKDGNQATRCPGCGEVRIRYKQRAPP